MLKWVQIQMKNFPIYLITCSWSVILCAAGKAHLRESLLLHEEALRLHRMCRQLRQIDNLQERLRTAHDATLDRYARCEQEDDFQEILEPPPIQGN